MKAFEDKVTRMIRALQRDRKYLDGENYINRSFIISELHQILG
jgi:hypothetical protein